MVSPMWPSNIIDRGYCERVIERDEGKRLP